MDLRVGKNWQLMKKIGSGAFGEIYEGKHIQTKESVAIKLEPIKTQFPQLEYENKLYRFLRGGTGIPDVYWYGVEGDYKAMVMEILGTSLEELFQYCSRKFSLKTVCMLGEQMITRLEFMHSQNFLHRDMKPDNFLMGLNTKRAQVYMIDFGLSKRYRDPKTGEHIPYRDHKSLTGTARYASVNTHIGVEQARRDDLESVGYILLYFLKGQLPWQGLAGKNKDEKYDKIKEKKCQTTVEQLTRAHPEEFSKYINYCRGLQFEEKPDYNYLRSLFKQIMNRMGYDYDGQYDWTLKKEGRQDAVKALIAQGNNEAKANAAVYSNNQQNTNQRNSAAQQFAEERKESRANLGAQLISGERGRRVSEPPLPQNKVIPRYNEFNNAAQYGKNQKQQQKQQGNPGFSNSNTPQQAYQQIGNRESNLGQQNGAQSSLNNQGKSGGPRIASYNAKMTRF